LRCQRRSIRGFCAGSAGRRSAGRDEESGSIARISPCRSSRGESGGDGCLAEPDRRQPRGRHVERRTTSTNLLNGSLIHQVSLSQDLPHPSSLRFGVDKLLIRRQNQAVMPTRTMSAGQRWGIFGSNSRPVSGPLKLVDLTGCLFTVTRITPYRENYHCHLVLGAENGLRHCV